MNQDTKALIYHVSFLLGSEVYLEQSNATVQEKVISIRLLDKAVAFDAFNVFPRHHLKCFPFPNQQHCSVLIDLAIRYNWPSITFHSKLIFTSVANQRKDGAVCIALICPASYRGLRENTRARAHCVSND